MERKETYTPSPEKGATILLPLTLQKLTDFQISSTDRLNSKFLAKC